MATPSIAIIPSGYKAGKVYSVLPTDGAGDLDFTRASSATRINKEGLLETVATGVPRLDYSDGGCPSLLLEPQSTNLIVNSELNNVENIVVSAVAHTISFYGTGSITLSGVHSATLSGTGANDRVSLTFTPSAGTLTCTDSGNVDNKQVEARPYATSSIPTAGAIATRLAENVENLNLPVLPTAYPFTIFTEAKYSSVLDFIPVSFLNSSVSSRYFAIRFKSGKIESLNRLSSEIVLISSSTYTEGQNVSVALKVESTLIKLFVNGVLEASATNTLLFDSSLNDLFIGKLRSISDTGTRIGINSLKIYNTALTDAELTTLTTL